MHIFGPQSRLRRELLHHQNDKQPQMCGDQKNLVAGAIKHKRSQHASHIKDDVGGNGVLHNGLKLVLRNSQSSAKSCELNAANAEIARFRCPQVGPLVGHNVSTTPMHFHHPLHQQKHLSAYHQYQHYQQLLMQQQLDGEKQFSYENTIMTMVSERKSARTIKRKCTNANNRPNSSRNSRYSSTNEQQQLTKTTTKTIRTIELPLENVGAEFDLVDTKEGNKALEKFTPDTPALVKVHTWYTVAKQGVTC